MSSHVSALNDIQSYKPPTKDEFFRSIYESKVESLHFSTLFKKILTEQLKWDNPVITNSYFSSMETAIDMAAKGTVKTRELSCIFEPALERLNEKGKHKGDIFKVIYFEEYELAYLSGFDYVGDELNLYAAPTREHFTIFFDAIKRKFKDFNRKENEGKLTIYTIEHGNARTYNVPFTPITTEQMVADSQTLADIHVDLQTFFADEELFKQFDVTHRRGIMFYGPPGCGKTMMCKHIATISKVPVVQFFASAGCDTGDLIKFFEYMGDISPAIVILEDLDSLFKGELARSNFLNIIDGACTDKNTSLLIIATTNHIKEIDEALTQRPSRFDRHYLFNFPSAELRREYIMKRFDKVKSLVENTELVEAFVSNTDSMSYAHLNEIYTQAALRAIGRKETSLKLDDVHSAITNVRKETTKSGGNQMGIKPTSLASFKDVKSKDLDDEF
jgi:AAA+ superfamily predicted ATPase